MKLEVGMYVRTETGQIGKITNFDGSMARVDTDKFITYKNFNSEITKASHNIIDLIQVGDYVNGEKVLETNCKWEYMDDDSDTGVNEVYDGLELQKGRIYFEYEIETVITKEQMEQMAYKVEE